MWQALPSPDPFPCGELRRFLPADRSLVVSSILTALKCTDELAFHVPAGLNHGLSRTEIEEIMVQMTIYGGVPRAIEGSRAMREAFARIDARAAKDA